MLRATTVAFFAVIACAVWFTDAAVPIPFIHITPLRIVKNVTKNTPNVTVSLWPALPQSQVFLLKTPVPGFSSLSYNCSTPPSSRAVNLRTAVFTLDQNRKFSFNPRFLDPGTYAVCFRNITQAASWYGHLRRNVTYGHFVQLHDTISIVNFAYCRAKKSQFGVCAVLPKFASSQDMNTTVGLYYAAKGTQAFLLKKKIFGISNRYNCSNPPGRSSHLKSPTATVLDFSQVKFDIHGLESGIYLICFKNTTSKVFVPLAVTMTISGQIDASRSSVSCCNGPFQVGQRTYCQIRAVDSSGLPAGGKFDACDFRACPITDGAGQAVDHVMQPYEIGYGLYEFWFVGTRSGCGASVGVSYKGQILGGNAVQYFTLFPGSVDYTKATSNCTWNALTGTSCRVVQRDTFGNPVSQCSMTMKGKIYCNKLTSHLIVG